MRRQALSVCLRGRRVQGSREVFFILYARVSIGAECDDVDFDQTCEELAENAVVFS